MQVTLFRNAAATEKFVTDESLDELRERILKKSAPKKSDLPWLKFALFGDIKTDKGSLRHDANVTAITGVEGDYDAGTLSFESIVQRVQDAKIRALVHTTASHTPNNTRARILCETSQPLAPSERKRLVKRLDNALGGILAPESKTLSQCYFYGHIDNDPHYATVVEGRFIDDCVELDAAPQPEQQASQVESSEAKITPEQLDALYAHPSFTAATHIPDGNAFRNWGCAISDVTGHAQWAVAKTAAWMARDTKWPNGSEDTFNWWSRLKDQRPGGITAATFFKIVGDAGLTHLVKAYTAAPEFSMLGATGPIPARPWLMENALLDGAVTLATGPAGGGKSILTLTIALSAVLKQHWSMFVPRKQVNVLLVNAEDDIDELNRRIESALHSFKGGRAENREIIRQRLHTMKASNYYLIAKIDGKVNPTKLHATLDAHIKAHNIGLVIYDPMISAHIGLDENSAELQVLLECFRNVAVKHKIPVLLAHHNKKSGAAGEADSARGSSTAVAAVRIVLNVDPMSEKEAMDLLKNSDDRVSYFSVSNSKANYSGKAKKVWYHIDSVEIGNEETAPGLSQATFVDAELTDDQLADLLAIIDDGMPDDDGKVTRYTARGSDATRLDAMIARDFNLSPVQAKSVVTKLVRRGLIELKGYTRPNRMPGKGYFRRAQLELAGGGE